MTTGSVVPSGAHDRFWSRYAAIYDYAWDTPLTAELNDAIHLRLPSGCEVVDVGGGTGLLARDLLDAGHFVTVVDSSAHMLSRSVRRNPAARHLKLDVLDDHATIPRADAIVIANLLHLSAHADRIVSRMLGALRPSGVLIATWPTSGLTLRSLAARQMAAAGGRSIVVGLRSVSAHLALSLVRATAPAPCVRDPGRDLTPDSTEIVARGAQVVATWSTPTMQTSAGPDSSRDHDFTF